MISIHHLLLTIWSLFESLAEAQYTASLVAVSSTTLSSGATAVMNCTATRVGGLVAGNHIAWEKKQGTESYIKVAATSAFGVSSTFPGTYNLSQFGWDSQNTYVFSVLSIKWFNLHDEGTYRCSYPEQGASPALSSEITLQIVGFALAWINTAAPQANEVYAFPPGNSNPLRCKAEFYGNSSDGDAKVFSGQIDISNTFSRNRTTYLSGTTPGLSTFVREVVREAVYVAPSPLSTQVTCKAIDGSGAVMDLLSIYVQRQAINVGTNGSAGSTAVLLNSANLQNNTQDDGGGQKLAIASSVVVPTIARATTAAVFALVGTRWAHILDLVPW